MIVFCVGDVNWTHMFSGSAATTCFSSSERVLHINQQISHGLPGGIVLQLLVRYKKRYVKFQLGQLR